MAKRRILKLCPALVTIAFAFAAVLASSQPSSAASALFRARRIWYFGSVQPYNDWWPIDPPYGEPPAVAGVGPTATHPAFTAPKSFIKLATYTFMCGPGSFACYAGYPKSSGWYSYWNGKGMFRPQNPYAPTTTTTIRVRTTMDGYNPTLMGWPTAMENVLTAMGKVNRTVTVATPSPTAGYSRITPTEGGCTGPIAVMIPPVGTSCPGTTQFNGYYRYSRGGSIMIWPGGNRFGGTMRWFNGPNTRFYQLRTIDGPWTSVTFPPAPLSLQIPSSVETRIGEVEAVPDSRAFHYQLTEPYHIERRVIGNTTMGGACTSIGGGPDCRYLQKTAQYLATRAPYTTGKVQIWEPNGNTNTIQTATGYDNRTSMGLNGTISLVHPRLTHSYLIDRSIDPDKPIEMRWSSARMRKIYFRFLPEPRGIVLLASGLAALAGLYRLRRR